MFGVSGAEFLIILIVALLVLGPEKLPGLARTLDKAMGELRKISTDFQRTLNAEAVLNDARRQKKQDRTSTGEPAPAAHDDAKSNAGAECGKQRGDTDQA